MASNMAPHRKPKKMRAKLFGLYQTSLFSSEYFCVWGLFMGGGQIGSFLLKLLILFTDF